ncbi:fatty-acid-CoA ligase [Mycobacterium tuberculosis]|nr:fatty-acid-CoA ligase [Mycobacterium tuberculosis]
MSAGAAGAAGAVGAAGAAGAVGAAGTAATAGPAGSAGSTGEPGAAGGAGLVGVGAGPAGSAVTALAAGPADTGVTGRSAGAEELARGTTGPALTGATAGAAVTAGAADAGGVIGGPALPAGPAGPAGCQPSAVAADSAVSAGPAGSTGPAVGARPTRTAGAEQQLGAAAGPAGAATGPTDTAGPAAAPDQTTGPTRPAGAATGPTDTAGAANPEQPPTGAAGTAGAPTAAAGPAGPAVAPQSGGPARPAGLAGRPGCPGPAVAEQQTAGPAGPAGSRRIGAVTDQRAPQQRLGGRIDHAQHDLLSGGGLGRGICARAGTQGLHKPLVVGRHLRTNRLVLQAKPAEQRRNTGRHLIGARSQHLRGRTGCRRVGRANRRTQIRQIPRGCCHEFRCDQHERHGRTPNHLCAGATTADMAASLSENLSCHSSNMCRLSGNAATNLERPGEEPPGDRCTRRQAVRPARTLAKKGNIPVGYYKDEKKTAETFRTINGVRYAIPGDYAQVEEDGTVTMLGRGSVSINSGGEKVYPEEVEAALKGHPDVFDALVVGVPDPRYGQQVAAVVQARPGCRPSLAELDSFVRSEIAGYKVPRSLWFVDEVKRSPAGKPDYRWAKEQTEARPADDVHAGHVTSGG